MAHHGTAFHRQTRLKSAAEVRTPGVDAGEVDQVNRHHQHHRREQQHQEAIRRQPGASLRVGLAGTEPAAQQGRQGGEGGDRQGDGNAQADLREAQGAEGVSISLTLCMRQ